MYQAPIPELFQLASRPVLWPLALFVDVIQLTDIDGAALVSVQVFHDCTCQLFPLEVLFSILVDIFVLVQEIEQISQVLVVEVHAVSLCREAVGGSQRERFVRHGVEKRHATCLSGSPFETFGARHLPLRFAKVFRSRGTVGISCGACCARAACGRLHCDSPSAAFVRSARRHRRLVDCARAACERSAWESLHRPSPAARA
mmetsp:Transcript_101084/g.190456  ORF Transcript_101084/g.190456 Transcript_101084/m.190456 type:complete len:201 (+) Transcript_101084:4209-4811(+)